MGNKDYKVVVQVILAILLSIGLYLILKNYRILLLTGPIGFNGENTGQPTYWYTQGITPYIMVGFVFLSSLLNLLIIKKAYQEVKFVNCVSFYFILIPILIVAGAFSYNASFLFTLFIGMILKFGYVIMYTALYFIGSYVIYKFMNKEDKNPIVTDILLILVVLLSIWIVWDQLTVSKYIEDSDIEKSYEESEE